MAGQGIVRRKLQSFLRGSIRLPQRFDGLRIVIASQGVFPSLQVSLASGQVETWVVWVEIQADIADRLVAALNAFGSIQLILESMVGADPGDEADQILLKDQRQDRIAARDIGKSVAEADDPFARILWRVTMEFEDMAPELCGDQLACKLWNVLGEQPGPRCVAVAKLFELRFLFGSRGQSQAYLKS